jgi:hypothetical protein
VPTTGGRILAHAAAAVVLVAAGCGPGGGDVDTDSARAFDAYPLYWLGPRFEKWDLVHVDLRRDGMSTFVYGECTPHGTDEPSCVPPLEIQIQPLCAHLAAVARDSAWKTRRIRGAPVGTIDSAPVLFSAGAQVKVYRGEGTDAALAMRALRALRSINRVPPVISGTEAISPPARGVLEGRRPCRA